jgi:hypothetical protein
MVNAGFELTTATETNDNDTLACQNVSHHANFLKEQQHDTEYEISEDTDIFTTDDDDDDNNKDELEVIKLQYEDDNDGYDGYALSNDPINPDKVETDDTTASPDLTAILDSHIYKQDNNQDEEEELLEGYRRMNLTDESNSDKDLIIYSLNESLQIHKEIVERIQSEKDDLEFYHEQEKAETDLLLQKEKQEFDQVQTTSMDTLNRLETMYQSLLKEVEAKKAEYQRMEDRFHSHLRQIRPASGEEGTVEDQIRAFMEHVQELCYYIATVTTTTDTSLFNDRWPEMMRDYFDKDALAKGAITMLTQKLVIEILVEQVLQTSIHPGVSLNFSFGQIHRWVEKRNKSWASRMKQQISAFVVKQSSQEEGDAIETAKERIVRHLLQQLYVIYPPDELDIQAQLTQLVNETAKLNLVLKCQEIDIVDMDIGSTFNKQVMEPIMDQSEQETDDVLIVACVISPPFVASDHRIIVPAKVYCV